MKKKGEGRQMTKASYVLLALIMAASMSACGSKKEEQQAVEQTVEAAEQAAQEQAAEEAAAKEAAEKEAAEKEAAAKEAAEKEAAAKEAAEKEAAEKEAAAKEAAAKEAAEKEEAAKKEAEVIQKPDMTGEEPKEESKKKKKEKETDKASDEGLTLLDGKMTFDGMELEFPIELDGMKLGNWKIEYKDVDDPENKVLAPSEIVTGIMTNEAFLPEDVTVTAEFGNYSNEDASLTDLPMTGIYITKEKGKDGVEPKLPEVVLPGNLTWGSKDSEIRALFGEASLAGAFFDKDFDYMYENGNYMIEFGGMNDTGIEYIVYCAE